jgi:hypothetical protein
MLSRSAARPKCNSSPTATKQRNWLSSNIDAFPESMGSTFELIVNQSSPTIQLTRITDKVTVETWLQTIGLWPAPPRTSQVRTSVAGKTDVATRIRGPKDFWAGLLYAGIGAAAILIARDYSWGTGARIGPAYFPTMLGALLLFVGLASLVRGFVKKGEPIGAIAWKGMTFVTTATVAFGFLLRPAGLVIALVVLILVSAAGSVKFRFDWRALALMVVLITFCALVFVKGLGLPVPLLGTWFAD